MERREVRAQREYESGVIDSDEMGRLNLMRARGPDSKSWWRSLSPSPRYRRPALVMCGCPNPAV